MTEEMIVRIRYDDKQIDFDNIKSNIEETLENCPVGLEVEFTRIQLAPNI